MMKHFRFGGKFLFAVFVAIGAITLVTYEEHKASDKYQRDCQSRVSAVSSAGNNDNAYRADKCQDSKQYMPWWYVLIAWPDGITVWALLATLSAIVWQAVETRRAAKAAEDNVEILVAKERARIDIEPYEFAFETTDGQPTYELKYRIINSGTTQAIIYFSRMAAEVSVSRERDKPERGNQMPLPNNVLPGVIELKTYLVGDQENFHDALQDQLERGELFVNFWGYINYRDLFFKGEGFWKKDFRYIWDAGTGRFMRRGEQWENSEKKKGGEKAN